MAGKVLGDYRVERRLGGGGFGAVYAGAHVRTGRKYALKILRPDRAIVSPDARERFRREAEALSGLGHIGIVAIHDYASVDGIDYIVMDLLEGEDLAARLTHGAFELDDGIELISAIGDALQTAHDANIIHRDLKPGNVFLARVPGEPERPVLLDFGLAKDVSGNAQSMTASGEALGTPTYMAPEQASGGTIDERTDVYALGALAYEVLSGEPPFEGANATAIILQLMTSEPKPLQGLPEHVAAAVHRALSKDADDRHATVRAFIAELGGHQPATRAMPIASVSPPTRVSQRPVVRTTTGRGGLWATLAVGFLVALGVSGWLLTRGDDPPEPVAVNAVPTEIVSVEPVQTDTETEADTDPEAEAEAEAETDTEAEAEAEVEVELPTETMRAPRMRRVGAPPPEPAVEMNTAPPVVERATLPSDAQREGEQTAELRALERLLAHLETMRTGLPVASRGQQPPFCRRSAPGRSQASSTVVNIGQRLDRIRNDLCEPFVAAREPSSEVRNLYRQLASTLDRSERMANDQGSYNQPVAVAEEVKAAITRARRAIEGVDQGNRAFPCDDAVWTDLRRLSTSGNSWSGTAARNVADKASRICSHLGLGRRNLGRVADRSSDTLDDIEGDIRSAIRPLRPL